MDTASVKKWGIHSIDINADDLKCSKNVGQLEYKKGII